MAIRPPDRSARINQLVGKRTGKVAHVNRATTKDQISARRVRANTGAGKAAISNLVTHGGGKISAAARNKHLTFGGGGGAAVAGNQAFESVFNDLSRQLNDYNRQITDDNAVKTAYAANVLDQQVDPNNPSVDPEHPEIRLAPSVDEQYLGGNLQKYVVGPTTGIGAAIPNTLYALAEGGYNARDAGAGYWEQTLEGLKSAGGAWNDSIESTVKPWENLITGKSDEKIEQPTLHGPGDIYELSKDRGDNVFADMARWTEKNHPLVEEQFSRGVGALGEWYMHPLGRMVGGGSAGVIGGKVATEESVRAFSKEIAAKYAADLESNIITGAQHAPGGYRPYMSEAAMADHVYKVTSDALETATLQVNAGGSKGRFRILSPKMTAGLAATHGSQALLDGVTSFFSDRVQKLVDGMNGRGTKLSGSSLDHWAALNPDFTELLNDLTDDLINKGHLPSNASRDMLAAHLSAGDTQLVRQIEQGVVDRHYSSYIDEAADSIGRDFRNHYYNTPAIRVGSKMIPVKGVGRAFSTIESKFFNDIGKNFNYNSVFPGSLSLDTTRARAWGVRATEEFEKEVRQMAAPFSKSDGIVMQHAIENNLVHTLPPEQAAVANWIKAKYEEMYNEEFIHGARGRSANSNAHHTPYDPNYAFVHNKGGRSEDRTRWKDNRKKTIHENVRAGNGEGAGRFKTSNAKEGNFRPVENAFEALRQRRIKHNRDMIRAKFLGDMVDKYSITARINPSGKGFAAESRGLEKVNFSKLSEPMRQALEKTGEDVYLPREMANMVNQFDDITKWHTGQQGRIARSFAEVMRVLKKAQTLPWPGFHNKNMIGDVFMGLLDHILPKDYVLVIQKGMAALAGKDAMFKVLKKHRGLDLSFKEFWHKYQSEANSGFISSELGTLESSTVKWNIPRRVGSRAEQLAVSASGFREDAGRFTHYVTAYKQEAEALWKKGERDLAKIEQKASSAALWRVNNYKFDYNALMLWEKKTKTLAFPFYTFARKAAPTLIQALYQDPRWITAWTRYMYQNQLPDGQEGASGFDGFRVPDDIRDAGYAFIGGQQDEPTYVSNDILPTSVFNQIRTENPHEFFNSIMSQAALPYQIAAEQGSGQQYFKDRPIEQEGIGDYLFDKLPGVREGRALLDPNRSWQDKLLTGRAGLGLPIRSLNENQQLFALQEWQDRMIDEPLKAVNNSQDLYFIAKQTAPDGKAEIFTVKNNSLRDSSGNATDVASYYNVQDAIQYVKGNLPDAYKKVPHTWDVDNQGKPVQRPVSTGG